MFVKYSVEGIILGSKGEVVGVRHVKGVAKNDGKLMSYIFRQNQCLLPCAKLNIRTQSI